MPITKRISQNRKKFIFKPFAWYHEYEGQFLDHPGVNPPAFIESEQPIRRNGQVINGFERGGYDQDFERDCEGLNDFHPEGENNEDESDSSSIYSFFHILLKRESVL